MTSNTYILREIFKGKLCRKTAALPAADVADAACVNNNGETQQIGDADALQR